MEKSVNSSIQQFPHPLPSFSTSSAATAVEESAWTAYLDDPSDDAYSLASSSLLSDAASHAAYKLSAPPPPLSDHLKIPKKLSLKPKAQFFVDTSLEDTASSPDNSPKVADFGPFDGNNYRRKSSLGNGRRMGEKYRDHEMKTHEYTDLKKRGLCLVPLSMLANYLG
ncbi:vascular-related unknown protein 1-like [Cucurbita moschata]|uniref:Uncharacterized protein n=1 Tax=Cucurbita moschata TaxID=3662 RepID=A0A6J1G847_CUCMO|nr:vascular-related unknown protein 1-like [Cucurbita moschata]